MRTLIILQLRPNGAFKGRQCIFRHITPPFLIFSFVRNHVTGPVQLAKAMMKSYAIISHFSALKVFISNIYCNILSSFLWISTSELQICPSYGTSCVHVPCTPTYTWVVSGNISVSTKHFHIVWVTLPYRYLTQTIKVPAYFWLPSKPTCVQTSLP